MQKLLKIFVKWKISKSDMEAASYFIQPDPNQNLLKKFDLTQPAPKSSEA